MKVTNLKWKLSGHRILKSDLCEEKKKPGPNNSCGMFGKFVPQMYEDLSVTRCFKCQECYHKDRNCSKRKVCEFCAEHHGTTTRNESVRR